jgi:hypothetical protein
MEELPRRVVHRKNLQAFAGMASGKVLVQERQWDLLVRGSDGPTVVTEGLEESVTTQQLLARSPALVTVSSMQTCPRHWS